MLRSLLPTLLLFAAPATAQAGLFEQDARLPALELPTIDGADTVRLSDLKGTPTLLIQFASW